MTNPTTDTEAEISAFIKAAVAAGYPEPIPSKHHHKLFAWARDEDRYIGWRLARALAAPVQSVPAGWKMAPVTPTEEMLKAADDISTNRKRWGDMLAAAPAAISATPAEVQPATIAAELAAMRTSIHKISAIAACFGCDHPEEPDDTELVRRVKWAARQLRAFADAKAKAEVQAEPIGQISIETRRDDSIHVAMTHNSRALNLPDGIHQVYTAPQAQPADALDAAFEAVRKRLCKIPRYSFHNDSRGNLRRVNESSGNWIEFEAAHVLFDPVAIDAMARKDGAV